MISIKGNNANYEGTSADTKPSGVPVNTIFRELDTNCYYYYTGEAWVEIPGGGGGGGGGTDSYNDLENKPQINSVTLSGNKTLSALGIQAELTIDSAPTEDSTNPVESGGVYEALALKQDTLTIDSAPTESSTNPVESGGVYTALGNKQDTLTFNGSYNASTNPAATVSTVTGAISTAVGNLTKNDVGLDNVTNDAQIKAVSGGVTSGDIVTFGADGATVQDSGKTIETTLTDSNDKLPTSKSIIDNAAGAAKLTGYTTDSSEQTISATSKITDAIEQLDYRTATNKTNILLSANQSTVYNIVDYSKSTNLDNYPQETKGTTVSFNNGEWTIDGTSSSGDTKIDNIYFAGATTKIIPNGDYIAQIYPTNDNIRLEVVSGANIINAVGINPVEFSVTNNDSRSWIRIEIFANKTFDNYKFKLMVVPKAIWDSGFTDYQPYAMSNVELTGKVAPTERAFSTANMSSLIYNEATAQGYATNNTLTYILSVHTGTDNEYLCAYGVYKHGVMHRCVAMVNNTISISAVNNLGTIALSGGTAPYYAKVKFF